MPKTFEEYLEDQGFTPAERQDFFGDLQKLSGFQRENLIAKLLANPEMVNDFKLLYFKKRSFFVSPSEQDQEEILKQETALTEKEE